MTNCLTDSDFDRYHAKEMDEGEATRVREHLEACPSCAERNARLVGEHDALMAQVRGLDVGPSLAVDPPLPRQIGGFRIHRVLGHGGMGVVFEAEQAHPQRPVALKVVRGGYCLDAHHIKLFQREAQTLARLRHPTIAAVYEAGRTDDGEHFFAMELVRGMPAMDYVKRKKLSIRARLELFRKICDGINYAHQRGVIHRDLKPSNILIDAEGNPKILDFGLAKMTDSDVAVTTVVTEIGKIQGTLPYMSPEQARGNPDEIDLRSDVYSLGVILYELTTGQLPYEVSRVMLHEAVRVICEEVPRRPSTISRVLRGDVETIALKALAKEPSRRYQSASALSDDIERYLTDQPILARAPGAVYQLKKFVRRNRVLAGGVAGVFLALLAGFIVSTSLYFKAEDNARKAEAARMEETKARDAAQKRTDELRDVTAFQASMLSDIDAHEMGRNIVQELRNQVHAGLERTGVPSEDGETRQRTADEISSALIQFDAAVAPANLTSVAQRMIDVSVLSPAVAAAEERFADQPFVQAQLLATIGSVYRSYGLYNLAEPVLRKALDIRRNVLGDQHLDVASSLHSIAVLLRQKGDYVQAESLGREALSLRRKLVGYEHPDVALSLNNLGMVLYEKGDYAAAFPVLREALAMRRRLLGEEHLDVADSLESFALVLGDMGDASGAQPLFRECLSIRRKVLGNDHRDVALALHNLGRCYIDLGDYAAAERMLREALAMRRELLGEENESVGYTLGNLASVLNKCGDYAGAERLLRWALAVDRACLGNDHKEVAAVLSVLGSSRLGLGDLPGAEKLFRESLAIRRKLFGKRHEQVALCLKNLGVVAAAQGDYAAAERMLREALDQNRELLGDEHPYTLETILHMGDVLEAQGKLAEAEPYYRGLLESRRWTLGDDHPDTLISITAMGSLLRAQGKPSEAIALLAPAQPSARKAFTGSNLFSLGRFLIALGRSRADTGDFQAAEVNLVEAHAIVSEAKRATSKDRADVLTALVELYESWHAAEAAKGHDAKAAEWRAKLPPEQTEANENEEVKRTGVDQHDALSAGEEGDDQTPD